MAIDDKLLWYATRGAGLVSLVLLTAVMVLGLLSRLRVERPSLPRFVTAGLHRNISLLAVIFLALHIVTAAVDPFTHLGLTTAVIPFGSYYKTFWLGLGTVSFELMVALVVTSLLRAHISAAVWRTLHWLAYASWPTAVVHGLGTGTDALAVWSIAVTVVCVTVVLSVGIWRLAAAPVDPLIAAKRRVTAGRGARV